LGTSGSFWNLTHTVETDGVELLIRLVLILPIKFKWCQTHLELMHDKFRPVCYQLNSKDPKTLVLNGCPQCFAGYLCINPILMIGSGSMRKQDPVPTVELCHGLVLKE